MPAIGSIVRIPVVRVRLAAASYAAEPASRRELGLASQRRSEEHSRDHAHQDVEADRDRDPERGESQPVRDEDHDHAGQRKHAVGGVREPRIELLDRLERERLLASGRVPSSRRARRSTSGSCRRRRSPTGHARASAAGTSPCRLLCAGMVDGHPATRWWHRVGPALGCRDGSRQPARLRPVPRMGERPHPDDGGRPLGRGAPSDRRSSITAARSTRSGTSSTSTGAGARAASGTTSGRPTSGTTGSCSTTWRRSMRSASRRTSASGATWSPSTRRD